jgi:hypothetical protein
MPSFMQYIIDSFCLQHLFAMNGVVAKLTVIGGSDQHTVQTSWRK